MDAPQCICTGPSAWTVPVTPPCADGRFGVPRAAAVFVPIRPSVMRAGLCASVDFVCTFGCTRVGSLPRSTFTNLTVVVTAGSGGTGSIGIELAKAWGAKHIVTATTGAAGMAFVRQLGADIVYDYKQEDIFDALPDDSVDIVYV